MPAEQLYPKAILRVEANQPRPIEKCWWWRPVQIDFDTPPDGADQPPLFRQLADSLVKQGHSPTNTPSNASDMIITSYAIPPGTTPLDDRIPEIEPPLALHIGKKYADIENVLHHNVTAIVSIQDDIAHMEKRKAERYTRMLMAKLGALKIIIDHPDYYAVATMEGGLGIEPKSNPLAIDNLRDRLVTHACAKESGQYDPKRNIINEDEWQKSHHPDYLVDVFKKLGEYQFVAPPFDISTVASNRRVALIQRLMGYGRQSEAAGLIFDPTLTLPPEYRMGQATGAVITTGTGRYNVNKLDMKRDKDLPCVGIVPQAEGAQMNDGQLHLDAFKRYAFGRTSDPEHDPTPPSIEFDEMAATLHGAPMVRVSLHENGKGYRPDANGEIYIPRVRAFLHMHVGIDEIRNEEVGGGVSTNRYVEYVKPNFEDFPYPVGCGKDIMFACSTDAAKRSKGVTDVNSGVGLVMFDATNHGTNFLLLTEPLPGTDCIPFNPFDHFLELVNPQSGPIRLSQELAQV